MSNLINNWTNFEIDKLARSFRRQRSFMKSLKYTFPIVAAILGLALVIYPNLYPQEKKIVIEAAEVTEAEANPPMLNPRFAGFDKDNQPYNLGAARAYQEPNNMVRMEEISADLTMKNGTWASVITPVGLYDMNKKIMDAPDVFEVFITEAGTKFYHMTGSKLHVDMNTNILKSPQAVDIEAPMGRLKAGGFTLLSAEGKIIFKGPVKLVIVK